MAKANTIPTEQFELENKRANHRNPIIGDSQDETISNVCNVLNFLSMHYHEQATTAFHAETGSDFLQGQPTSSSEYRGLALICEVAEAALMFEQEG